MAAIGQVVIDLQARNAHFSKGIKKASTDLKGFGAGIGKISSMLKGFVAAAGVYLSVRAFKNLVGDTLSAADSTVKLSNALDMSAKSLYGLQQAAKFNADGVGIQDFNVALQKFADNLGTAAMAGGPVSDAIERLGLSANNLTSQKLDESLIDVAEAIHKIDNPMQRASILVDLFGRSGQKLAPMFEQGGAGVRKAIEETTKGLDDVDFGKLAAANRSIEEMQKGWERIKITFVTALAPVVQAFFDKIKEIIPTGDVLKDKFVSALRWIAKAVAYGLDLWQYFKVGILTIAAIGAASFSSLTSIVTLAVRKMIDALNLIPGVDIQMPQGLVDFEKNTRAFADSMFEQIKDEASKNLPSEQVDAFFDSIQNASSKSADAILKKNPIRAISDEMLQSRKDIEKWFASLDKEVRQFGMDKWTKQLDDFKALAGVTLEDIKQAEDSLNILRKMEQAKEAAKDMPKLDAVRRIDFRIPEQYRNKKENEQVELARKQYEELRKQNSNLSRIAQNTTPSFEQYDYID